MEAVKHKMDSLIKEKIELNKQAVIAENATQDLQTKYSEHEKAIKLMEKQIANAEEELDITLTKFTAAQEKLEEADETATNAELEVNALTRRIRLLAEESSRIEERYKETLAKIAEYEKVYEENERERKIIENSSFANDEKLEIMAGQLEEANNIADESDRKYEEVSRKAKIVEGDLERVTDKGEDLETKIVHYEQESSDCHRRLKEIEEICGKNAEKEDEYDNQIRNLTEKLKIAETNAEFGERTVEKLENTIDSAQGALFEEKNNYRELSMKLDATLEDMMTLVETIERNDHDSCNN